MNFGRQLLPILIGLALPITALSEELTPDYFSVTADPQISYAEFPELDSAAVSQEEEDYAAYDFDAWYTELMDVNPELMYEPAAVKSTFTPKLVVEINQKTQRMQLILKGKKVMKNIRISTGYSDRRHRTPDGRYRPGEMKVSRQSKFASREYGRPIYLKWAVQITGGIFLHAASQPAMRYLGRKHSSGCVRVDNRQVARVYKLIADNRNSTQFYVHH